VIRRLTLAAVAVGVTGMVTLACGGGGSGDEGVTERMETTSRAPVGTTLPVVQADPSWPTLSIAEGAVLQVPRSWTTVAADDRTIELRPPESRPAEAGPLITITYHPGAVFQMDGPLPARQTAPQPVDVAGVQGRAYADAEAAVPHHGYTVELPWRGGTLEFFAVSGPAVNLVPQLEEILKTVKLT